MLSQLKATELLYVTSVICLILISAASSNAINRAELVNSNGQLLLPHEESSGSTNELMARQREELAENLQRLLEMVAARQQMLNENDESSDENESSAQFGGDDSDEALVKKAAPQRIFIGKKSPFTGSLIILYIPENSKHFILCDLKFNYLFF